MVEIKTPAEIALMREAGRVVANALAAGRRAAEPGRTTADLDRAAAKVISDAGAEPLFQGYQPGWAPMPFPGVACVSVNDEIVHGVPGERVLAEGDLVSLDCGARLRGWSADSAISFVVGEADPADLTLIADTEAALARGIAAARPGDRVGDIGHAIATEARAAGYGLTADHGGHGIGRTMHEAPDVLNDGRPGRGFRLVPGLVIAIEPMLVRGGSDGYAHGDDGWTVLSDDGTRAAHCEHTVAVTEDGPVVLTLP
ncbi:MULTISPECIES: type I methionyl aminopeptidase [unclassified Nocardiopsis]|jgi:methionyl aminopeptidase|uniref:type I methionyl aminopeptidase n=1 Tax=unclassified Nocardiopsis TaxID=2649073 RepID=UPI00066EBB0F|nr:MULTISPECIES: type I methionyl aminopeptidase [unclassified Nocardiopsis]MBQ1082531.1 type I methionyl aminopeptidase [Nocardiopsis sp. B62]